MGIRRATGRDAKPPSGVRGGAADRVPSVHHHATVLGFSRAAGARIGDTGTRQADGIELRVAISGEALAACGYHRSIGEPSERCDPVAHARRILSLRRSRDDTFPDLWFGEPTWDLLLDLYVESAEGRRVSVSSACIASRVPHTTGLRHLTELIDNGHVLREPDPLDARRTYVRLSPSLTGALEEFLSRDA